MSTKYYSMHPNQINSLINQLYKKTEEFAGLTSAHLFGITRRASLWSASLAVRIFSNKGTTTDLGPDRVKKC